MYHDPVHGTGIGFEKIENQLIHSAEVQRLRNIRQLSTVYIPYPHANHTRYEHVLGTTYLVKVLLRRLTQHSEPDARIESHDVLQASVAAILHDIGHSALGHGLEKYGHLVEEDKLKDKTVSQMLLNGSTKLKDIELPSAASLLEGLMADDKCGDRFDPEVIGLIINGSHPIPEKQFIANLISGPIDADRMDYLLRDAYHTTAGGRYDFGGIIENVAVRKIGETERCVLAFYERGIPSLESLVASRDFMYAQVYHNRLNRISQAMIARAIYEERKKLGRNLEDIWLCTDERLIRNIIECNPDGMASYIAKRIMDCKPYYVDSRLCLNYHDLEDEARKAIALMNQNPKRLLAFEREIAESVGLEDLEVVLDLVPEPKSKESSALIIPADGSDPVDLKKKSRLVSFMTSEAYLTARSELIVGINVDDMDVLSYLKPPDDPMAKIISAIREELVMKFPIKPE
jgi:HD superfamily phosphohydrolase